MNQPKMSKKQRNRTLKKMNCNPNVKNKSISKTSCFTKKVLNRIKRGYNKNNSNKPIKSTNSKRIYSELLTKLDKCNDESCWLNEIDGPERKIIQDKSFTPNKPREWVNNPVEWLSNFDILNVLKQYEEKYNDFKFIGPTPIDFNATPNGGNKCVWQELCTFNLQSYKKSGYNDIGVIFNLDKHNEGGSHWVSLFISIKHNFIYYFDSAANDVPAEIKEFIELVLLQSNTKMKYFTNVPHQHQYGDTECGMYSLYFMIKMLDESESMKSKIELFSKRKLNDKFIQSHRDKYFN